MAFVCPNLVHETTTTTGTGAVTLLGAVGDAQDFDSQLANGDTVPYTIEMGSEQEAGIGTFSTSGPTLTRTTILWSTNGGAAVNFSAGTKNVIASLPGSMVTGLIDPDASTGMVARTAAQTYARRTITAGAGVAVTDGDGVAGQPTVATTFLNPGTGAVARTGHDWMEDRFSLRDFGVLADGSDESATIQAAVDAAEAIPGTEIWVPPGAYNLGTTGITILGDGIKLQGSSPRFVGGSLFGCEFTYSGTGTAVTFGSAAKAAHYRNGINDIQIRATGSATTTAAAVGVKLINQHYLTSTDLAIKDFLVGTGLLFQPLDDGVGFGALNNFRGLLTHLCKIGIKSVGISAFTKENVATFYGGATIHNNAAGSIGCDLDQYTDGFIFYGTDFESAEIGVKVAGGSNHFIGTRSEFNTNEAFQLTSTAIRTNIIGHQFAGSATLAEMIVDNAGLGLKNWMINENGFYNPPVVQPLTDRSEAFYITKADGSTVVLDVSTTGTPQLAMVNGADILGWSDAFTTLKYKLTGASGDIKGVTLTASGTAVGVGAGEISIGGDTAATVGAAGGAAELPFTPLGYINCYVAGVAVKIPYYNN